jgi:hypothetical protein
VTCSTPSCATDVLEGLRSYATDARTASDSPPRLHASTLARIRCAHRRIHLASATASIQPACRILSVAFRGSSSEDDPGSGAGLARVARRNLRDATPSY